MSEDIIINAVSPKVRYIADGITKSFSFVFPIFSDQDMDVYIDDTLIKSGYSITGVGTNEGGEVIFNTAPKNGKSITLLRNLEIKRTSDFQESGAFRAKAINYELDYQIACLQQLNEQISRSVSFPPYSENAQTVNLPAPENGKAIVWDNNGASLRNSNLAYDDLEQLMLETKSTVLASEQNVISKEALAKTHEQNAGASKEEARKWAVGTIQEQPNGSAKYWAEKAQVATTGTLNESILTNCITKIPQDIKLELADKKLYLSIGSKVYDGNGLLKTITEQTNQNYNITAGTRIFLYEIERNTIVSFSANRLASGDSLPADNTNCDIFYLTSDKKVYRYLNSVWSTNAGYSFPICIATTDGVGVTSIDQVFNGFGYIGSTIFALPGVEGLIPNGRNTDGSLNNTKFKTSRVLSQTNESTYKGNLAITSTSFVASSYTEYNEDENFNKTSSGENYPWCFCGGVARESGRITSFNPKLPVKLADDQDVVHKTGNETIEGNKTFLPDARTIYLKDNGTVLEDSPSINRYPCRFIWLDKNNKEIGFMQMYEYTDGKRNIGFGVKKKDDSSYLSAAFWVENSGKSYMTLAESPELTDKSNKVPTTQWVKNYGAILDYSAGITITGNGDKTAPKNGVLMINASTLDNQGNEQVTLVIEGQTFYFGNGTVNLDSPHIGQIYFPMKSGQSYNISSPRWNKITARFFPYV